MSSVIECPGCRSKVNWDGELELKCPYCGEVVSNVQTLLGNNLIERLGIAAGYRRVGRFDDSQQELENILESNKEIVPEALFGCFLNSYEITEYAFGKDSSVNICKCNSTSKRPVEKNRDWQDAKKYSQGKRLEQWTALSKKIEDVRQENIRIKNNLPKYRAIIICDYENDRAKELAHSVYDILSTQTDVFFPPETLKYIKSDEEKDKYLIQAIKNPEIAQLMFVIYSDTFNYRNKAKNFFYNVAGQCREFAKVHTKAELFSVTDDYEASPIMKTISIKTMRCKTFDSSSYNIIAKKILDCIIECAYDYDESEEFENGKIIKLNEDRGLSPKVRPLE
ncbi:MAG: hypothetical protein HDT29_07260 [Clostridiales bacterium]|nr:hypothetical protein [Clostridiales bacterium]